MVSSVAACPSTGSGSGSCDGYHVSTNGTDSPASRSNRAVVVRSSPVVGRPGTKWIASGPAIAVRPSPSPVWRTHGTTWPKSKRRMSSIRTVTRPLMQRATRTTSGAWSRIGIESTIRSTPSSVWKSVSSTSVSLR